MTFVDYLDTVTAKIEADQETEEDEPIYYVSDEMLGKVQLELSRVKKNFTNLLDIEGIELRDLSQNFNKVTQDSRM